MKKSKQVTPAVQEEVAVAKVVRKEMFPLSFRIGDVIFETKLALQHIKATETGMNYWKLTIGKEQDKNILFCSRKDGKGVCAITDWEAYQYKAIKSVVTKVA